MENKFNTPILVLCFNRPDLVKQLIRIFAVIQPPKLFVSCDGPRHEKDKQRIAEIKKLLDDNITWKCKLEVNFSEKNSGCKLGVKSGIDWFFSKVDEGIILEDDCQPNTSFFFYCQDLLKKYRTNQKIMTISGSNFLSKNVGNNSYFFSHYPLCWGWATWKRAWTHIDLEMKDWSVLKKKRWLNDLFSNPDSTRYWSSLFDRVYENLIDTWDYQWVYSIWKHNGIAVIPNVNLIKNVGFGVNATHTKLAHSKTSSLATHELLFPLDHPTVVRVSKEVDDDIFAQIYRESFIQKVLNLLIGTYTHQTNSLLQLLKK